MMVVGIVDYGMGNLRSVFNAFEYIGARVKICSFPEELSTVDRIVLPGVGAIAQCIKRLEKVGFLDALNLEVLNNAKPTLGICLGMQVMATKSYEGGEHNCLGWFDAEVVKIKPLGNELKVPIIGWNTIKFDHGISLFRDLPINADFYFVHSYQLKPQNPDEMVAFYDYGEKVTAAILRDNVFATQFHPEKSQDLGLKLLDNFLNWKP
jgi:glutamine amidotransferase